MWRCVTFFESFKRGRRVISRDQTIKLIQKVLDNVSLLEIPPMSIDKESINVSELQVNMDKQNLFSKILVPSLASANSEFEKTLAGMMFVEYDPILDPIVSNFFFHEKKVLRSAPIKDEKIEDIINSIMKIEKKDVLKEGDVVEVIEGDYKGIIGRIETINDSMYSIIVQFFGTDKILKLTADQIKIAEDN